MYDILKNFYLRISEPLNDDEILFYIINESENIAEDDKEKLIKDFNLIEYKENDK